MQIGENTVFAEKIFACAVPKDTTPPNFVDKSFANSHKTAKFVKVFSCESFLLYGTLAQRLVWIAVSLVNIGRERSEYWEERRVGTEK